MRRRSSVAVQHQTDPIVAQHQTDLSVMPRAARTERNLPRFPRGRTGSRHPWWRSAIGVTSTRTTATTNGAAGRRGAIRVDEAESAMLCVFAERTGRRSTRSSWTRPNRRRSGSRRGAGSRRAGSHDMIASVATSAARAIDMSSHLVQCSARKAFVSLRSGCVIPAFRSTKHSGASLTLYLW